MKVEIYRDGLAEFTLRSCRGASFLSDKDLLFMSLRDDYSLEAKDLYEGPYNEGGGMGFRFSAVKGHES